MSDVSIVGTYTGTGLLEQLEFTFEAQARGALFHHDFHLNISKDTFGSSGVYNIEYYDTDGSLISSTSSSFDHTAGLDLTIFADTYDALPPNDPRPYPFNYTGNAVDGSGLQPGRKTIVTFVFTSAFSFPLSTYTPEYVGLHGDNLFFDPYLYVLDTTQTIHITDIRLIIVPIDWEWPQETKGIWLVYPYNGTEGVYPSAGGPIYTQYWYTVTPTGLKWNP